RLRGRGDGLAGPASPHLGREAGEVVEQLRPGPGRRPAQRLRQGSQRVEKLFEAIRDERDEGRRQAKEDERWLVQEAGEVVRRLTRDDGGPEDGGQAEKPDEDVHRHSSLMCRSASATAASLGSSESAFSQLVRARSFFPSFK